MIFKQSLTEQIQNTQSAVNRLNLEHAKFLAQRRSQTWSEADAAEYQALLDKWEALLQKLETLQRGLIG